MGPVVALRLLDLDRAPAEEADLAAAERGRARALGEPARRRFVAGRTALRRLLAARLGGRPAELPIVLGPFGKPALEGARPPLAFSLAHAGRWGLVALGAVGTVGVDLERLRPLDDPAALAARLLPEAERRALGLLPAAARCRALFRAWVREEARRKAAGTGLLDRAPMQAGHASRESFAVVDLEPGPGLVAALATRERLGDVCYLRESMHPAAA